PRRSLLGSGATDSARPILRLGDQEDVEDITSASIVVLVIFSILRICGVEIEPLKNVCKTSPNVRWREPELFQRILVPTRIGVRSFVLGIETLTKTRSDFKPESRVQIFYRSLQISV